MSDLYGPVIDGSIRNLNKSTTRLTVVIIMLNIILVLLTGVLVWLTVVLVRK